MIVCLATWAAVIRQRPAFCLVCLAGVACFKILVWACVYLVADLCWCCRSQQTIMGVCLPDCRLVYDCLSSAMGCRQQAQTSFVLFECLAGVAGHWRPCAGLCVSDFRWCVSVQCGQGLHSAQAHQTQSAQGKDGNAFSYQCALNLVQIIFVAFYLVFLNCPMFDYMQLCVSVLCTRCASVTGFAAQNSKENLLLLSKIYHALRLGHKQCHHCFQGHLLGIQGTFLSPVAQVAIDLSEGCDPAVKKNAPRILKELQLEEERFSSTLGTGQKLLTDILQQVRPHAVTVLCHTLPYAESVLAKSIHQILPLSGMHIQLSRFAHV